ncbi:hypothetical protein ABVN80_21415 [Acinetobacter baumannii]
MIQTLADNVDYVIPGNDDAIPCSNLHMLQLWLMQFLLVKK